MIYPCMFSIQGQYIGDFMLTLLSVADDNWTASQSVSQSSVFCNMMILGNYSVYDVDRAGLRPNWA